MPKMTMTRKWTGRKLLPPLTQPNLEAVVQADEMRFERRVRRFAANKGYLVRKSRVRSIHLDNFGDYILINANTGFVAIGSRFDASLDDILAYLGE
jgi:hypothetical protein